jgi:hypothetical protein
MAHTNKKPVPNMVGMRANAENALIMKDMGNGHMRPYMWGTSVTVASGGTEVLVADGSLAGVNVEDCVYTLSNGLYMIEKDTVGHTVKVKILTGAAADVTNVDVMVFMSTAITVDVDDYAGKRGYLTI